MNPFERYMTAEDHLQHQVIMFVKWQFPELVYHHSPNEGKRTPFEQYKYKYLGSDSGFPDLIFPELDTVIELKVKPNKPSLTQLHWLDFFKRIGWRAEVCYTYDEAVKVIKEACNAFKPETKDEWREFEGS